MGGAWGDEVVLVLTITRHLSPVTRHPSLSRVTSTMRIHIHHHWLPKAGNRSEEYEDAFWPTRSEVVTGGELYCAVADGATETSFSGQWARQLVRAFGNGDLAERDWTAQLAKEQSRWLHTVQRKPLPWYAEEKARSGAFAALLGLTVGDSGVGGYDNNSRGRQTLDSDGHRRLLPFSRARRPVVVFLSSPGEHLFCPAPVSALQQSGAQRDAARANRCDHRPMPRRRYVLSHDRCPGLLDVRRCEAGEPPWRNLPAFAAIDGSGGLATGLRRCEQPGRCATTT